MTNLTFIKEIQVNGKLRIYLQKTSSLTIYLFILNNYGKKQSSILKERSLLIMIFSDFI
jgi:hypothetical protein